MAQFDRTCPLSQLQVIDEYFMEQRTKLLDIAAFLDRLERASIKDGEHDFRLTAFRQALRLLGSTSGERVKEILLALSDPTIEPLLERDRQNAFGAHRSGANGQTGDQEVRS